MSATIAEKKYPVRLGPLRRHQSEILLNSSEKAVLALMSKKGGSFVGSVNQYNNSNVVAANAKTQIERVTVPATFSIIGKVLSH